MRNSSLCARSLILTGPTGSGKTALALALAEQLDAEIVSMDSMTLYRGFDIGTAKPTPEERARVAHHLIDVLEPWESGNVAWWLERAAECVADIEGRGKVALFVGGTPLYLKALLRGLFRGPSADLELRQRLEMDAEAGGVPALHARLAAVDPAAAGKIHANDLRRIVRALEVFETTGRPISSWQQEWNREETNIGPEVICLDVPRAELYSRIDRRVIAMLESGWLDETRQLRESIPPPSREASAAVGYRDLWAFLAGERSWEETVSRIQQWTRNYAKRQLTWFRQMQEIQFATPELTIERWRSKMNEPNRTRTHEERHPASR